MLSRYFDFFNIGQSLEDLLQRKRSEVDEALSRAKEENLDENKINEIVEQIGKKYKLLQSETQRSAADDLERSVNQKARSNAVVIIIVSLY
jgi:hypothetical protein